MSEKEGKKIKVNQDLCIGCGSCEQIAPEHFELNSEGKSEVKKQYDEKDKDIIEEAVESCPVDAITVE